MGIQHFFADGKYLGSRRIPDNRVIPGLDIIPQRSLAFFCTRCGKLWGQVIHEAGAYHQCYQRWCQRCGDGRLGVLPYNQIGEPNNVEADWPTGALRRELAIELSIQDKT